MIDAGHLTLSAVWMITNESELAVRTYSATAYVGGSHEWNGNFDEVDTTAYDTYIYFNGSSNCVGIEATGRWNHDFESEFTSLDVKKVGCQKKETNGCLGAGAYCSSKGEVDRTICTCRNGSGDCEYKTPAVSSHNGAIMKIEIP